MTVTAFISSCRAERKIPVRIACRALGVSESWYFKWPPTPRVSRRAELTAKIQEFFDDSGGTYGSPRITLDLREAGWRVWENTVAKIMAENGCVARPPRRRKCLTRQRKRPAAADLLCRDFSTRATAPDTVWVGDVTMIPHRRGTAVPGQRARPVQPPAARLRDERAPRRAADLRLAEHGRRDPRRAGRRGDLPLRPRQ